MKDIEKLITDLREVFAPMVRELCADDKFDCDELCAGNIMTSECIIFRAASALKRLNKFEGSQVEKLMAENERLLDENERLRAELAESQRRERAAVEDLLKDSHCTLCKHHLSEGGDCYGVSKCAVNGLRVGWEWRGPVAGKGEAK